MHHGSLNATKEFATINTFDAENILPTQVVLFMEPSLPAWFTELFFPPKVACWGRICSHLRRRIHENILLTQNCFVHGTIPPCLVHGTILPTLAWWRVEGKFVHGTIPHFISFKPLFSWTIRFTACLTMCWRKRCSHPMCFLHTTKCLPSKMVCSGNTPSQPKYWRKAYSHSRCLVQGTMLPT